MNLIEGGVLLRWSPWVYYFEVAAYIRDQEKHHERKTFQEEYLAFLELFNVDYDERYIFHSDASGSS